MLEIYGEGKCWGQVPLTREELVCLLERWANDGVNRIVLVKTIRVDEDETNSNPES